ncbi:carbohydrate kinase family protein [Nocardiopsis changdeensis]|uniref:Carbohydrate kinase family protein n=1 Tax=Nocardiopsis changdeensis TaxID=2831969 RepID=A0ABX8BFX4_9ACTN|nr:MULTISPECIES: carbohydrate kinase family protein [Nocardiopsis]QUX21139.1 carbohydrate kinase family protein [Nocardiopsis changdeensis]QYX37068.1 carbohydrate kinase family protein [Nocardiopsis sp. MT53]
MTHPRTDVLVVGGTGVDTIVRVPDLAVPAGDSASVPPVLDHVGHTGNGVALGLHHLGRAVEFIDFLGEDLQGRMILERYEKEGLAFSHLVSPHGTPRGVNLVDDQGRRFSFYDGRHPVDLRLPREFALPFLERARHVHMSIINHNRDLYRDLAGLDATVSTDLHDWDGENPHHLDYALNSDLVFMSAAAVRGRVDEVLAGILERGRAVLAVATDGAAGCRVLERGRDRPRHFPAVVPERPVVDANGAGDAFISGFLHRYLGGAPVAECVLAGAVAGAFTCTTAGTHTAFVDSAGLDRLAAAAADGWPGAPDGGRAERDGQPV